MDTITHKGLTFRVDVRPDDGIMGAPWDEHDGHGPVRLERSYNSRESGKRPGERILYSVRGTTYLYDWQEAMALAKRDGWGLAHENLEALKKRLGREPKPGDIRAEAVQQDFDYCRRYASGDWHWCGVVVTLLDTDGNATHETESLWGIESDSDAYRADVAKELAGEIAKRVGRRKFLETRKVRVRE